jgi:hypothetical protein
VDEERAKTVGEALDGYPWEGRGDMWLVIFRRADARVVTLSREVVCEYVNEAEFEGGRPVMKVFLR